LRNVVFDAKRRGCFHNDEEEKNLARAALLFPSISCLLEWCVGLEWLKEEEKKIGLTRDPSTRFPHIQRKFLHSSFQRHIPATRQNGYDLCKLFVQSPQ